jgi:ribosomal protein S18 acetylase RimI-like enzyme
VNDQHIEIVDFDARFARETVRMWRASKKAAIGIPHVHTFSEDLDFLTSKMVRRSRVLLAIDRRCDKVAGMLAIDGHVIDQLYVRRSCQRQGIGSLLLHHAMRLSPVKLQLFTFEVNHNARKFYEKHGFTEIGRGYPNEENLPDIMYEWNGFHGT